MPQSPPDTGELVDRAAGGDAAARQQLLARHRVRLRRMVAVRLDRRLAARVDPSDLVQESLGDAARGLDAYLRERPLPFYPWLRQFAVRRLTNLHRDHIAARRRSVTREEPWELPLPDQSAVALAERLVAGGTSPSGRLMRSEQRAQVQEALAALDPLYREVLVLRHLEGMSITEVAAALGITVAAAKKRHVRALERIRERLGDEETEGRR
jgi:RNA polymerase sigma-70 factor (ECF subfamily)